MSLAERGKRWAFLRFLLQGELQSHPLKSRRRKKGPEILSPPLGRGKGSRATLWSFKQKFATKYQTLGVLKSTSVSNYESFHLSTCLTEPRESAKVQQVRFSPRIKRADLVHPGAPLLMLSVVLVNPLTRLPGSSDLLLSLNFAEIYRTRLEAHPQIAPPRTRSDSKEFPAQTPQEHVLQKRKSQKLRSPGGPGHLCPPPPRGRNPPGDTHIPGAQAGSVDAPRLDLRAHRLRPFIPRSPPLPLKVATSERRDLGGEPPKVRASGQGEGAPESPGSGALPPGRS